MADIPITREEKYLAYLTGDYKADVPKPITRQERYLYELCLKGMGGEISPEEIQKAVNDYLDKNPVKPGATTEQAAQIEQNKTDIASLKTETSSLKESISTKITKFYASSQGETHLADSDDGKIMDMMLYGKSEQKQYSGKNLVQSYQSIQIFQQYFKSLFVKATLIPSHTYTLSFVCAKGYSGYINENLFEQIKDFTGTGERQSIVCKTKSVIPDSELYDNGYVFVKNKVGNTVIPNFSNVMFEDGESMSDDYEPYTGGIPSPNPDYPQEIKSVVNPMVKVRGKNLLKATLETTTLNGVTCTANGDGTYTLNGTATERAIFAVCTIQDDVLNLDTTYTLVGCPSGGSAQTYFLAGANYVDSGNGRTANPQRVSGITISIVIGNGVTANNLVFKPMFTADTSAKYDDFEPYKPIQTITLPYTLNAIPVSSGGNVTIGGQQYIADYFDAERGKLMRMVGEFVQNNQEWRIEKSNPSYAVFSTRTAINNLQQNDDILNYCSNYFKCITTNNRYSKNTLFINSGYVLVVTMPLGTIIDDFLALVKDKLKVFYELATPIEIDLTSEEIAAFKSLASYYPTTNISVSSEQLDGYTVLNYPISMENGWNYVKQQIGDTREYIYDMDARTQDTDLQAAEAYVNSEYAVALTELEV